MKTTHLHFRLCILAFAMLLLAAVIPASAQTPNLVAYQGRIAVGTTNFEGTGNFRFALVSANGNTVYWSNSPDVSPANGTPDAAVNLTVTKGLYSVLLGDSSINNMATIPASVWANTDVRLRVWFNDGTNGTQQLTPDQRLAPTMYLADGAVGSPQLAANAVTSAKINDGAVTNNKLNDSAVTSLKIANNAVDATKIAAGAVGATQLANNAVDATKIANSAVGITHLASDAVGTGKLQDGAVTSAKIATGAIGSTQIAAGSIGSTKLNDGAVSTDKLADGAVTAAKLGTDVGFWSITGSDVFRSAGNVGIGTTTPTQPLTVAGNTHLGTADNSALAFDSSGFGRLGFIKKGSAKPVIASTTGEAIIFSQTDQTSVLDNVGTSTLTERMRIASNGNVGIGTATPSQPLTVVGNTHLGTGDNTALAVDSSGFGRLGFIKKGSAKPVIASATGEAIIFSQTDQTSVLTNVATSTLTERMRIHSDGSVGIGTNAPGAKFEVSNGTSSLQIRPGELNGTASTGAVTLDIPGIHTLGIWDKLSVNNYASIGGNGTASNVALRVNKTESSHAAAGFENEAGTDVLYIGTSTHALFVNVSSGYAQRNDNSAFWSVTSDRRLKTGIVPIAGALDTVGKLNPVRYHYTAEHLAKMPGSVDKEHYGIVAQEFQTLFPQFVTTGANGYLSVQSDPLIFVATAAIKELHAKHDAALAAKDAEIAALKKQLSSIDARLAALEQSTPATAAKAALKK